MCEKKRRLGDADAWCVNLNNLHGQQHCPALFHSQLVQARIARLVAIYSMFAVLIKMQKHMIFNESPLCTTCEKLDTLDFTHIFRVLGHCGFHIYISHGSCINGEDNENRESDTFFPHSFSLLTYKAMHTIKWHKSRSGKEFKRFLSSLGVFVVELLRSYRRKSLGTTKSPRRIHLIRYDPS